MKDLQENREPTEDHPRNEQSLWRFTDLQKTLEQRIGCYQDDKIVRIKPE